MLEGVLFFRYAVNNFQIVPRNLYFDFLVETEFYKPLILLERQDLNMLSLVPKNSKLLFFTVQQNSIKIFLPFNFIVLLGINVQQGTMKFS